MILQLDPPIPLLTPRGKSVAHLVIDNGLEHDLQWICMLDDSGECWTFNNREIRAQKNITHGRVNISPFHKTDGVELVKCNHEDVGMMVREKKLHEVCMNCGAEGEDLCDSAKQ